MIVKKIEEKQNRIDCFHKKIKEVNKIDNPYKSEVLKNKKLEEHEEVLKAIENINKSIEELHSEIADIIVSNRDNENFDFRVEFAKAFSKYGIFELIKKLSSEDEVLKHSHYKVDRTTNRLLVGYYGE